jgi:hypothetical protein
MKATDLHFAIIVHVLSCMLLCDGKLKFWYELYHWLWLCFSFNFTFGLFIELDVTDHYLSIARAIAEKRAQNVL